MKKFSDLHCHNHTRSFYRLRPRRRKYEKQDRYNPWTVVADNMRRRQKARMAGSYGQCDLAKMWNGGVRLVFNSLYPMEKGIFKLDVDNDRRRRRRKGFRNKLVGVLADEGLPLRDVLHGIMLAMPDRMTDFFQSDAYDYWAFLQEEYAFAIAAEGEQRRSYVHLPGFLRQVFENRYRRQRRYRELLDATGAYRIPRHRTELEQCLDDDDCIVMVLTIEGGHAFGTDRAGEAEVLRRIHYLKREWAHPLFFITIAHHFNNELCGHAHSFPAIGGQVMNQRKRMDGNFTRLGWRVLRKLLALDADNRPDPSQGYRVLIDVKHLAARSRKQYYEQVVRPCAERGDVIPVIASHCGYSGMRTLDAHIDAIQQGREKDDFRIVRDGRHFYAWSINMCDEDIRIIHRTRGLFGLSFDQRMLGMHQSRKKHGRVEALQAIYNNICGVLEVIYQDPDLSDEEKRRAWDMITIGTDFDGYIDPINGYPTNIELRRMGEDRANHLERESK